MVCSRLVVVMVEKLVVKLVVSWVASLPCGGVGVGIAVSQLFFVLKLCSCWLLWLLFLGPILLFAYWLGYCSVD